MELDAIHARREEVGFSLLFDMLLPFRAKMPYVDCIGRSQHASQKFVRTISIQRHHSVPCAGSAASAVVLVPGNERKRNCGC